MNLHDMHLLLPVGLLVHALEVGSRQRDMSCSKGPGAPGHQLPPPAGNGLLHMRLFMNCSPIPDASSILCERFPVVGSTYRWVKSTYLAGPPPGVRKRHKM